MFDNLSDKLESVFKKLRGQGVMTEDNIKDALREVRLALLEADVNFKVVKEFVEKVHLKAVGTEVLQSLAPGQQDGREQGHHAYGHPVARKRCRRVQPQESAPHRGQGPECAGGERDGRQRPAVERRSLHESADDVEMFGRQIRFHAGTLLRKAVEVKPLQASFRTFKALPALVLGFALLLDKLLACSWPEAEQGTGACSL